MSNENVNKQDDKIWDELKELKDYEFLAEDLLFWCKEHNTLRARISARNILKYISNSSLKEKDIYKRVIKEEEKPLSTEVEEYVRVTECDFSVTDVRQSVTRCDSNDRQAIRREYNAIRKILQRLKERKIIESTGKREGWYRKIDRELIEINWKQNKPQILPFKFPLDIHELFELYTKNICVFASHPNGGKTAYLLAWIKMNMELAKKVYKKKIKFFSSEMMDEEMSKRLSLHEDITTDDWDFEAYVRNDKWADVIEPDGVNVIDYLDFAEPYDVKREIREIHNKLNKGIAIIGLQKPFGRDMGYGKEFGMQIPRLYVSIDNGVAKILKCKNWRTGENPNNKILPFKLYKGWKFQPEGIWRYEGEDPFDKKIRGYK